MVACSLVGLFGATALTVDLGNAWQNKRQLNTTSDAAALGAAARYAAKQNGCLVAAPELVSANDTNATMVSCTTGPGWVQVQVGKEVDYVFGPVIGVKSQEITSTTTVRYGVPTRVGGLRPFALCIDALLANSQYQSWVSSGAEHSQAITIQYGKNDQPNACNGGMSVPGNWAILDFDGGANSNADTMEWVMNGYPGWLGPGVYEGDPGALSQSLGSGLAALKDSGETFGLPVFSLAQSQGANAEFTIVGFAKVKLVGYQVTGNQHLRSLTLIFMAGALEGECCDPGGINLGATALQICSVDPDDLGGC